MELIRWGANSAKLFSMGNFKNRLAAIQTTSLVARSQTEAPNAPDGWNPRLAVMVAAVGEKIVAYPRAEGAYPAAIGAYPGAESVYPVASGLFRE
jgi:hypothetical protein